MIRNSILSAICFVGVCMLVGCNAGMEAQGPSAQEAQQQIAKMPPQQQIDLLRHSPLPKAEQDRRVAEIRAKYGLTTTDNSASQKSPTPGQPPVNPGK